MHDTDDKDEHSYSSITDVLCILNPVKCYILIFPSNIYSITTVNRSSRLVMNSITPSAF